jgi:uncharacterized repeat protein (TIGR01451 family)
VLSNQVSTTVAQVGGVTLTNAGNQTAAAGNIVYIPHDLINTGNGTDSFTVTALDPSGLGTFSNVAIYSDPYSNGKGSGDPLCASKSDGTAALPPIPSCSTGFVQSVTGNGGTVHLVAAYTIPPTATQPTSGAFNTATVTATPVTSSVPYPGSSPFAVSETDTVNVTTSAAFASTKAIAAPGVAAPGATSGGWPTILTGGKATTGSDTACPTAWGTNGSSIVNNATCTYTVYTISYANTGGAVGAYSVSDAIPSGMTYVTGSAVWSGASGTALKENGAATPGVSLNTISSTYLAATGTPSSTTPTGTFSAKVSNVMPGTNGTISFVVRVNSTAAAGSSTTTNTALFSTVDCTVSCSVTTPTNPSDFPVTPTYGVIAANATGVTTYDAGVGAPSKTKPGVDVVEPDGTTNGNAGTSSAFLGSQVKFTDYVINTGNGIDTFNVTIPTADGVSTSKNSFPVGTTFAFFKLNGTPLISTDTDSIPDTGPIPAGGSVAIVVVATLPSTATLPTAPVYALMTATSFGAGTTTPVVDSVWNELDAIKSTKVDLTNSAGGNVTYPDGSAGTPVNCTASSLNCDLGQGPTSKPTDIETTTPATPATFPVYLTNLDTTTTTATYNLTATVPNGWTVKFVAATDSCTTGATITSVAVSSSTASTGANQTEVKACVTPPAGTSAGTSPVAFTATKVGDTTVTDTITDAVKVTAPNVPAMQLGPVDSTNTTPTGGTTLQPETLTNTGTTACGSSGFNVALSFDPAAKAVGWTALVFYDANNDGKYTTGEPIIGVTDTVSAAVSNFDKSIATLGAVNVPLGVGSSLQLLVKTFAPGGAVDGSTATATLTITDVNSNSALACPAQTSKIATKITNGTLSVVKAQLVTASASTSSPKVCDGTLPTTPVFVQAALPVKPGDCIVYQVVATNTGAAPVTNVVLSDAMPAYTTYNATQPAPQCVVSATGTVGAVAAANTGNGTATTAVACSGGTTSPGLTLNPQGTVTMYYAVQVQQ